MVLVPTYGQTKVPKFREERAKKRLKFCQDRSYENKEDWSKVIFVMRVLMNSIRREILEIMSSGLQRCCTNRETKTFLEGVGLGCDDLNLPTRAICDSHEN